MNKKGVSTIIASVIMIALVLVIGGVVWGVVNNIVQENLEGAGNCYDIFEKINFNSRYTCWNSSAGEMRFSISMRDIDLQEAVIVISGEGNSNSYTLRKDGHEGNIYSWPDSDVDPIIPGPNTGKSYATKDFSSKPDSIQIFPIVNGKQCDAGDTLNNIDSCFILS